MLCQEPWCFTPAQVGRLTDWQVEHLYAKPAAERAERMQQDFPQPGGTPATPAAGTRPAREASAGPPGEPGSPEHRAACVAAFVQFQGLKRERAERQYERQLAAWLAEKGG